MLLSLNIEVKNKSCFSQNHFSYMPPICMIISGKLNYTNMHTMSKKEIFIFCLSNLLQIEEFIKKYWEVMIGNIAKSP